MDAFSGFVASENLKHVAYCGYNLLSVSEQNIAAVQVSRYDFVVQSSTRC